MCIIVTKKQDFALPNEATLRRCFESNPDGAGFAWSDAAKVYWRKGYETFEAFYTALKCAFPDETIEKQHAIVLHFRIGTHGPKKSKSHMHPFPVDVLTLQQTTELEGSCSMALFHNGVISDITRGNTDKVMSNDLEVDPSDSMILAYHYVRPMLKAFDLGAIEASTFNLFMEKFIGTSRIALLEPAGVIDFYGSWVEDKDLYPGCMFSNSGYQEPKVVTSYYTGKSYQSNFNDDNFDYWYGTKEFGDSKPITKWEPKWSTASKIKSPLDRDDVLDIQATAFWSFKSKLPYTGSSVLLKLPTGARVSVTKKRLASYAPALDGDLYYSTRFMKDLSKDPKKHTLNALLYVKDGEAYYYIGTFMITMNKEVKIVRSADDAIAL